MWQRNTKNGHIFVNWHFRLDIWEVKKVFTSIKHELKNQFVSISWFQRCRCMSLFSNIYVQWYFQCLVILITKQRKSYYLTNKSSLWSLRSNKTIVKHMFLLFDEKWFRKGVRRVIRLLDGFLPETGCKYRRRRKTYFCRTMIIDLHQHFWKAKTYTLL